MAMKRLHVLQTPNKPRRRSGILSVWSAFALVAVGLVAVVAIDRGLVSLTWSSTQLCVDSAALAGCRELLTDDLLRDDRTADDLRWQTERCKGRAIELADRHCDSHPAGGPVLPRLQRYHVELLKRVWSEDRRRYTNISESLSPDMVRVRLSNRDSNGHTGSVGISGVSRAVISCEATAWLHDRICGFQTGPGVSIPLAPLAIPEDDGQQAAGTWSATDASQSDDHYAWDREDNALRRQADGLAELSLTITRTQNSVAPGRFTPVLICDCHHETPFAWRMQHGLKHDDAQAAGLKQLSFPRSDASGELKQADFEALAEVLFTLVGKKRLFPLADLNNQDPKVHLTDVVAARILDVRLTGSEQLHVLLQPTVMSPASAVVCRDTSVPPNRYVRKIALLR